MNRKEQNLQDSCNNVSSHAYIASGHQSISPSSPFDSSLNNIPTPVSIAGMDFSRPYTTIQDAVYDRTRIEGLGSLSASAFYDRKNSCSWNDMSLYSNKDIGVQALSLHNAVGNLYGNPGHFSLAGDNLATDCVPGRSDQFMAQFGSSSRVPSSSLFEHTSRDFSSHRRVNSSNGDSHHPSPDSFHFGKSVPAYIPLGSDSNYVYFNPSSLNSFTRSELPYQTDAPSSLSSLVGSSNSDLGNAASHLMAAVPSAHRLNSLREEQKRQSPSVDNVAGCESIPTLNVGPEWNRLGAGALKRETTVSEPHYYRPQTASTSTKSASTGVSSVKDPCHAFRRQDNAIKEKTVSPVQGEASALPHAAFPRFPERMFSDHEISSIYSQSGASSVSSKAFSGKSSPSALGRQTKSGKKEVKGKAQRHTASESLNFQMNSCSVKSGASNSQITEEGNHEHNKIAGIHKSVSANTQTVQQTTMNANWSLGQLPENMYDTSKRTCMSALPQGPGDTDSMFLGQTFDSGQFPKTVSTGTSVSVVDKDQQSGYVESGTHVAQQRFTTTFAEDSFEGDEKANPRIKLIIKKQKPSKRAQKIGRPVQRLQTSMSSSVDMIKESGGKIDNRMCPICQKTFTRADSLTCHMRVHTGERPYQCHLCHANYKIAGHLRDHVRSKHSNSRPYVCLKCGKGFAYPTARRRHEKVCGMELAERIEFRCSSCDKGFVTAKGFMKHQEACGRGRYERDSAVTADTPFKCIKCEKSFATFSALDRHQRFICGRMNQKGAYSCEECDKVFLKRSKYLAHTRRHTGEKPYKCWHCDMSFYDQGSLTRHTDRHDGNKRHRCSLCEAAFYSKQCLAIHVMRVHCGLKPFKCGECGLELPSGRSLDRHIRNIHGRERKFKCNLCIKRFLERGEWKRHMYQHTHKVSMCRMIMRGRTVQRHTCNVCSKSFPWKDLHVHVSKKHPGITSSDAMSKKLLKCDFCSKQLSCQRSLVVHKRQHACFKPFKCNECGMPFNFKSVLDSHRRRHSNYQPPNCCHKCGKTFHWTASLSRHLATHHNSYIEEADTRINIFTCNVCSKQFKREDFLSLHLKGHGNGIYYICSESHCGQGFVDIYQFKAHMTGHKKRKTRVKKAFVCPTCGAGFRGQYLLDKHQKFVHLQSNGQTWQCEECGKFFNQKECMLKHKACHVKFPETKTKVPRGRRKKLGNVVPQGVMPDCHSTEQTQMESREQQTEWRPDAQQGLQHFQDTWGAAPVNTGQSNREELAQVTLESNNAAATNFSVFGDANYQSRFSSFIHQTLAWPRPEEQ